MYQAVDVMGFAGGFTCGVVRAGWELVGKRELPGGFGVANCEANRHILGHGWTSEVGPQESWTAVPGVPWTFGNPPCSGFSVMTDKNHRGVDAKVNQCMWTFVEYAARNHSTIITFESVRSAYSMGHELMRALRTRLEERTGSRYDLYHVFHDAYELGGAARRPRYFWVASRVPFGVEYPRVKPPTMHDVIGDLMGLAQSWYPQPYRRPATWWSETPRRTTIHVDGHATVDNPATQRALDLLEMARGNGGWPHGWHIGKMARHVYQTYGRLPDSWSHMTERLVQRDFNMGFTTLTRWDPGKPCRVVTGGGLQLIMHPWEDRTVTHREVARIMGFPDDWRILPLRGNPGLNMTWGKGITTQCGSWIATWVRNSLDGNPGSVTGIPVGERERIMGLAPNQLRGLALKTRPGTFESPAERRDVGGLLAPQA